MTLIQIPTASDMSQAARLILERATTISKEGAVVVTFSGDLGAGKTTLVQSLAAQLGVSETVTSPTYVIMKGYELPEGNEPFSRLLHIDAYRIEDIDEMRVLGFSDLLLQNGTIICIEWPERMAPLIPPEAISVAIAIQGEGRTVTIS